MKVTLQQISERIRNYNRVIIVGYPKSGKSTLIETIKRQFVHDKLVNSIPCGYDFIQTDDYMKYGYKQQLYILIDDLQVITPCRYICEGVQGYRLLRKIEEQNLHDIRPDLVITCKTDRPMDNKHAKQRKGLDTVWDSYTEYITDSNKPGYWVYEN